MRKECVICSIGTNLQSKPKEMWLHTTQVHYFVKRYSLAECFACFMLRQMKTTNQNDPV